MIVDRRNFIRLAGVGVAAAATGSATKLIASDPANPSEQAGNAAPVADVPGNVQPLTAKRWAMVIDTRKANPANVADAVNACHKTHNVPQFDNAKDEVKWIWSQHLDHAFHEQDLHYLPTSIKHKPTLMLCNHCDDPPCTQVCPTSATWKRKSDGIVMMDWHRCVGCRYCVVACPYGSRSFNFRDPRPHIEQMNASYPTRMRGVVEKCTFCEERLARGQQPACVEATAASGMIAFGDLEDPNSEVSKLVRSHFTIRRKPGLGTQPEVYYIVPTTASEADDAGHQEGGHA